MNKLIWEVVKWLIEFLINSDFKGILESREKQYHDTIKGIHADIAYLQDVETSLKEKKEQSVKTIEYYDGQIKNLRKIEEEYKLVLEEIKKENEIKRQEINDKSDDDILRLPIPSGRTTEGSDDNGTANS